MKSLFAIQYSNQEAAQSGLARVRELAEGEILSILDAAIVRHLPDGAVKIDQTFNLTAVGAVSGAFWGSLVGLLFLNPLLGAAAGAGAGALSGYASDYGISDAFMERLGKQGIPGSATLFVLASDMSADKVGDVLSKSGGDIIYTSMSTDVENQFHSYFLNKKDKNDNIKSI